MIPIPGLLFNPLMRKVIFGVVIVIGLAILFGVYSCKQKAEDKARIKHNNQKRDTYVEKETMNVKNYQEREERNFLEKKRYKILNNLYIDKNCLNDTLNNCQDGEDCKDIAMKACNRPPEKPTREDILKKRESNILDIEGVAVQ